jgi:hypothetical protein
MNTNQSGEQRKQLTDAICAAFDDDSFELWLDEEFGTEVRASIARGPRRQRAVKLIEYFEQRGEEEQLLLRLASARGHNKLVRAYLKQHAAHLIPVQEQAATEQDPATEKHSAKTATERVKQPTKVEKASDRPEQTKRRRTLILVVLGAFCMIGLIVALLNNPPPPPPKGTVLVKVENPDLQHRARGAQLVIVGPGGEIQRAFLYNPERFEEQPPGTYTIRIERAGLVVDPPTFDLKSGETVTVQIKRATPADPNREMAEYALSIGGTVRIKDSGPERDINIVRDKKPPKTRSPRVRSS